MQMQAEGLKRLRDVLYRTVKGLKGACVVRWQTNRAENRAKMGLQTSSMQRLSTILARLWKGELYERIIIWHLGKEAHLRDQGQIMFK